MGEGTTSKKDFSVRRSKNRRVFTSYVAMRLFYLLNLAILLYNLIVNRLQRKKKKNRSESEKSQDGKDTTASAAATTQESKQ